MRKSNIDLVKKTTLSPPIVDIGGADREANWDFDYYTLDINPEADIVADVTNMDNLSDNIFGTIICLDTLEHVNNPFNAVDEMYRVLKKNGTIILSTVLIWDYHEYPKDYFRFTLPCLEMLCRKFKKISSGWQKEEVPFGDKSYKIEKAGVYFVGIK